MQQVYFQASNCNSSFFSHSPCTEYLIHNSRSYLEQQLHQCPCKKQYPTRPEKKSSIIYFFGPDNDNAEHQEYSDPTLTNFIFLISVKFIRVSTAFNFITVTLPKLKVVVMHEFEKVASVGRWGFNWSSSRDHIFGWMKG